MIATLRAAARGVVRQRQTSMISASFTFKRSSIDFVWSSVIFCTCCSATALLVVADVAFHDELLQVLHDVAAHVADRDLSVLGDPSHDLDEILAPLLGERWNREPHDLAVVRRRQPEVRLLDRALDVLDRAGVERLHDEQPRLRRRDRREALERRRRAVVVDRDAVEECRRRAARPDRVELVVRRLDGLVHPPLRVREKVLDRSHEPSFRESR